jgi:hypothetical protein
LAAVLEAAPPQVFNVVRDALVRYIGQNTERAATAHPSPLVKDIIGPRMCSALAVSLVELIVEDGTPAVPRVCNVLLLLAALGDEEMFSGIALQWPMAAVMATGVLNERTASECEIQTPPCTSPMTAPEVLLAWNARRHIVEEAGL